MTVSDTRLTDYAVCPIGTFEAWDLDGVERCAVELLRWTAWETFNGRLVPLSILRKKFVTLWNAQWPENATRDGQAYWAGVRSGRAVAARLGALFAKYEVLRPYQPYELPLEGHCVTGAYLIIGRRPPARVPEGPYVLVVHPHRPITFTRPDLAALACWKHAMMSGEYVGLGIYHFPLVRGLYWRHRTLAEPLVTAWLASILGSMSRSLGFPTPSGHCEACIAKRCMKVFDV